MTGGFHCLGGALHLGGNAGQFPSRFVSRAHKTRDDVAGENVDAKWLITFKAATTSGLLSLLGDTAAQLQTHWVRRKAIEKSSTEMASYSVSQEMQESSPTDYDFLRAMRMTTYGFFVYGPVSQIWYDVLDQIFWQKTLRNLSIKVAMNQVVLGPFVMIAAFTWNSFWQGKLDSLPDMFQNHGVSTLVDSWKFWIPASVLNFGAVPLEARVAFMSTCSIFWNFYISNILSKS
eukprot:c22683_g1_i1 orf=342-1037(+)